MACSVDGDGDGATPLSAAAYLSAVDPRLAEMERVFRAPPLTPELAAAITLIAPHFAFTATGESAEEEYRRIWEADQNGACWREYETLAPLFRSIPKPKRILEIGPGMGRSLVFFSKKLVWDDAQTHAYEADGTSTKYTMLGPRFEDSFCGNIRALRDVLNFNGMHDVTIFNARDVNLKDLPGPYDLIYSFYSIGFHWSLEHFLDDLLPLMGDRSIAVFTTPLNFRPFPGLTGLHYRSIDFTPVWPKDAAIKMLLVSKSEIPEL
jgi:hypothetical protein